MSAIMVALFSALVAMTIGSLVLRRHMRLNKIRSQSFKFHELRDRLQLLAIEGKLTPGSPVYDFLAFTLNLAIRNAGEMRLSELLRFTRMIDGRMKVPARDVFAEFRSDSEVQKLAADVFNALSQMLIANDFVYVLARAVELSASKLRGAIFDGMKRMVRALARIVPVYGEAIDEARKYRRFGDLLT